MNASPLDLEATLIDRFGRGPLGVALGLFSAVTYTAANTCLRSIPETNPTWVSCVKSVPLVLFFGPWLLVLRLQGARLWPGWVALGWLFFAGVVSQYFGNVYFQAALGTLGIAITVPITLGSIIATGAVMGRVFLGEQITWKMAGGMTILVAAILILGFGAETAGKQIATDEISLTEILLAVLYACIAGLAYAILGVCIRYGVRDQTPVATVLVIMGAIGVLELGGLTYYEIGWDGMQATTAFEWSAMAGAGFFNAVAFLALVKSLQYMDVAFVNSLNATQASMAALVGLVYFREPLSPWLGIGVAMTVAGLLLMRRDSPRDTADAPDPSDPTTD